MKPITLIKEGAINETKRWEDYDTIVCPDGTVIDMNKLLDDQYRAKTALVHLNPAFGGLINMLRPIYTFRVETQATDGKNIYINPQFTYGLDLTEKCFVMAHEIMHNLLNHLRRAQALHHDPNKSNIAADYECNISLVDMDLFKFDTIKNLKAYIDKKYSGWGYEKIYDDCNKTDSNNMNNSGQSQQAQKNQQNQQGQGQGQSGQGQNNQKYSADYIKGWNKAYADYKAGKLKI